MAGAGIEKLHSGKTAKGNGRKETSSPTVQLIFSQRRLIKMRKTELKELYKMMFPNYPDIVTVAQLQEMLGVSRHLAYDLISDGYISGVKIGNAYKIPKVNVINYVMEEGVKNAS